MVLAAETGVVCVAAILSTNGLIKVQQAEAGEDPVRKHGQKEYKNANQDCENFIKEEARMAGLLFGKYGPVLQG